jgi:hypothetical protein
MAGESNTVIQPVETFVVPKPEAPKPIEFVVAPEVEPDQPSSYERLALGVLNSIKDPDVRTSVAVAQLGRLTKLEPGTLDQISESSYGPVYERMARLAKNMGVEITDKNPNPLEGLLEIMAKSPDDETSFALGMMTLSKQHRYIAEVDNVLKAIPVKPDAQIKQLAEDPSKMNSVLNTGKDPVSRLILNASNTLDVEGKFFFGVFAALKSGRAMNNNPERFAERHKSIVEGITEQ